MNQLYEQIARLGRQYGASKIILFGSRARGDHRPRSDIDLAVFGMPRENQSSFWSAMDDLPTLLDFDLVFIQPETSGTLLENIRKDGINLMNKVQDKYNHLQHAVTQLKQAIADYETYKLESIRDGIIQRFEYCAELSWKVMREYLLDQGYDAPASPKGVMKQAYADGILNEERPWLDLLNDRNLTSHVYDEATAVKVTEQIISVYTPMFEQLVKQLEEAI